MSDTLTVGGTVVELGDQLLWADEFAWVPVSQQVDRSTTGALLIQTAAMVGGRPITLTSGGSERGWTDRAALLQCQAWAGVPGQVMTLNYRGVSHTVIWRIQDGALEVTPVNPLTDDEPEDPYIVTLRFMEIA